MVAYWSCLRDQTAVNRPRRERVWLTGQVTNTGHCEGPPMNNEIEIVSDGEGLAVVGRAGAVERFLRSKGLWVDPTPLQAARLDSVLRLAADATETASEVAASSVRWVKLTEESAQLVGEHGLMDSKTPGISHVMIGVPGEIKSWLQA